MTDSHSLAGLEISTDKSRLDVDLVHRFLTATYWAQGRRRSVVQRSIDNSVCFGAYVNGSQVGFARAVTDKAVFAYVADVFVLPEYRGRGISKALMTAILAHPDLQNLRLFLLRTRDAHGLYSQFGFTPVQSPENLMEILDLESDQRETQSLEPNSRR